MREYNALIEKLEAQADQTDRLEAVFSRMTASRVLNFSKSKSIAGSLVILSEKFREYNSELGSELDITGVIKGFVAFIFEKEESLILGILADVFAVDREDAKMIPFSCIYECIFKDKVVQDFLSLHANAVMQRQSNTSTTATSPLPPIPFTSNPGGKKTLTGSNTKAKK